MSWANEAKETAVGIARLVGVACKGRQFSVWRSGPASLGTAPRTGHPEGRLSWRPRSYQAKPAMSPIGAKRPFVNAFGTSI